MSATSDSIDDGVQRSRIIRQELMRISDQAFEQYPILRHQDAIGLGILLGSSAMILASVLGYAYDALPAWLTVVSIAFFTSLLHELEHDLIHRLYFRARPWLYNTAMGIVWFFRPNTVSPWVRRDWHLHHHRASGMASDIEERGLTNGETWGLRRLLMTLDPFLAVLLRPLTIKEMLVAYADGNKVEGFMPRVRNIVRNVLAYFPMGPIYAAVLWWTVFLHVAPLAYAAVGATWTPGPINVAALPVLDFLAVTVVMPGALRIACLYFVSSNIHYHGDIEPKNVVQQTQVWTAPWLWPAQAFCFNFGGTHAIHHFAVQYPFYLRQMVARECQRVMRENGVRFNDFSSMLRANRWHAGEPRTATTPRIAEDETSWSQAASAGV